jgi:hypothetical protein
MKRPDQDRLSRKNERWLHDERPLRRLALTRHLAIRGDPDAITELERVSYDPRPASIALSPAAMVRCAATRGKWPTAAFNIAMQRFNARDLRGYRYWLRRAAQNGDDDAGRQLARFETRLPHGVAHDLGRGRPYRPYD